MLPEESDLGIALAAVYRLLRLKLTVEKYEKPRRTTCLGCGRPILPDQKTVVVYSGLDWYGRFCRAACCQSRFIRFIRELELTTVFMAKPTRSIAEEGVVTSVLPEQSVMFRD